MKYTKTLLAIAAMSALTISCSDTEYFDKDAYDKLILDAFPVKNIDPNQTWTTISSATVKLTLNQKSSGTNLVCLYDRNPNESGAKLYAKKTMSNGETYTTSINYLTANPTVYIMVTSHYGYKALYTETINNGLLVANIGNGAAATTKTRAFARSLRTRADVSYGFTSDISDYPTAESVLVDSLQELPSKNIQDNTSYKISSGESLSVDLSGTTGVSIYFTEGSHNITKTKLGESTSLYLLANAAVTSTSSTYTQSGNSKIVICQGASLTTLDNQMKIRDGINVYNSGTIEIGSSLYISGSSALYNNGTIKTSGDLKVDGEEEKYLGSTSSQLVNAGTINCDGTFVDRGAFKNDLGTVTCKVASINFFFDEIVNNAWVNSGTFTTTDKFTVENVSKNSTQFINQCRLEVGTEMVIGGDVQFDNEGGVYVTDRFETGEDMSVEINLASLSIFKSKYFEPKSSIITGPSTDNDPALIIADEEFDGGNKNVTLHGYLFIDCKDKVATNYVKEEVDNITVYGTGHAPITISGSCTGTYEGKPETKPDGSENDETGGIVEDPTDNPGGIEPSDSTTTTTGGVITGGDSSYETEETTKQEEITQEEIEQQIQGIRYCYEDNFPFAGDYDMNDLVLDVKTVSQSNSNKVDYYITLKAVGATKQLAGALCLRGINTSDISNFECGSMFDWNDSPIGAYDMIKKKFNGSILASTANTSCPVFYLFNDAHYSMLGSGSSSDGSRSRPFINTVPSSMQSETVVDWETVNTVTCCLTIEFNSETAKDTAIVASNIDPFIVESNNGVEWEVHPYLNKTNYALYDYSNISNYKGVTTWVLQTSDSFSYPKEFTPITTAYPGFANWAENMNSYQVWDGTPADGEVYNE